VQVTLGFTDGSEEEIELTAVKEQSLWEIDSLDPLRSLVAAPSGD
jgi:hypothetical protein